MKLLKQAIHTALRDDSVATVGLRALLGHAALPFGVYYHFLPEQPDFSTSHWLTWHLLTGSPVAAPESSAYLRETTFDVTAWSEDPDKVEDILLRVRAVLENARKVTRPTSECDLHAIKWEGHGPDLFDPKFQVYFRSENYRAFHREDVTS